MHTPCPDSGRLKDYNFFYKLTSINVTICLSVYMKTYLSFFFLFFLISCSVNKNDKLSESVGGEIKDRRLATDFTDEGIKITYTLTGDIKILEVSGQAEAWKTNVTILAEADAMAKLTKYIYGKDVSTSQRVQVIGKSMEKFNDNLIKSVYKGDEVPTFTDKQIEDEIGKERKVNLNLPNANTNDLKNQDLTRYQREAKVVNDTTIDTMTKISSTGKLQGVRKVRDYVKDDGKTYVAVYVWSDKDIETINYIRQKMLTK